MIDDMQIPFLGCSALFAAPVSRDEVSVILFQSLRTLSSSGNNEVFQVYPCFSRVVRQADPKFLKSGNATSCDGVVEKPAKRRCPCVVRDEMVEPGKVADLLTQS